MNQKLSKEEAKKLRLTPKQWQHVDMLLDGVYGVTYLTPEEMGDLRIKVKTIIQQKKLEEQENRTNGKI